MKNSVAITPCGPVDATIQPPGSKSITNRAIVCAALADGPSLLHGVLDSDDTGVMIAAWQQLGLDVQHDRAAKTLAIQGCGGDLPIRNADLFIGNSGTTIRFMTAALAACTGTFTLDGVPRMRQRPIGDLLSALRALGSDVRSLNAEDPACPPVHIQSSGLPGGTTQVAGNMSSQFLSGLMLAAPMAAGDVCLEVIGELVSVPYVEMTSRVMSAFGARISGKSSGPLRIEAAHRYRGTEYAIEPDASAASYFWAAAAIAGGRARVMGLSQSSLQGDVAFCSVLEKMGCQVHYTDDSIEVIGPAPPGSEVAGSEVAGSELAGEGAPARGLRGRALQGVDMDMADISDTVQTLAAVALFAKGPTTIRGVAHNRLKETDRITDLARELRKLGASVEETPDGLRIEPPEVIQPAEIETYEDHRMAMSLALVGLRIPGITILDPGCTAKTYPNFWQDLALFSGCRVH